MKAPYRSMKTAACLAVGLVSTWDWAANAQVSFSGEITPTHDLSAVYFLFAAGPCAPAYSKKIAEFLPANITTPFDITMYSIPADLRQPGHSATYTIIGLYDAANGGVTVGYNSNMAAAVLSESPAPEWSGKEIPGSGGLYSAYIGATESDISAALQTGTYAGISLDDAQTAGIYVNNIYLFPWSSADAAAPSVFTLIDFSGASAGGSGFVVEVVPEPATISCLVTGAALLSFGWLRRRK